jgi:hypothetical protein
VLEISGQEIPDDLNDLVSLYREKLDTGEAHKYRVSGYVGKGII